MKNNLQTVAALLRLQARRLDDARGARPRWRSRSAGSASIALVHETLSTSPDERVDFDEIVDRLLRDGRRGGRAPSRGSRVRRRAARFGILPPRWPRRW